MSTPLERLRALVENPETDTPDADRVMLGLLVVAEAIHAHTEVLREGFKDLTDEVERAFEALEGLPSDNETQAEAADRIAKAIRDLEREVAFAATRVSRGA